MPTFYLMKFYIIIKGNPLGKWLTILDIFILAAWNVGSVWYSYLEQK